jgi:tRNA(Ile)-lysidine synthase
LKYKISIAALHVNHSLRGKESDEDEQFCEQYCKKNNIEFCSAKVDVKKTASENSESIEEAARNLRYNKLDEFAAKIKATKIVTAHNLDDNTETILLNLFRGSGLKGVSGIPIQRGIIIRPLLSTSKKEILSTIGKYKLKYRTDSTNLESDYTRNFLRNEIIPQIKEKINPALDLNLLRFSEIAKESNLIIESIAEDISNKHILNTKNEIHISDLLIKQKTDKYFSIVVRKSIEEIFGTVPTFTDISQIRALFNRQVGNRINLSEKLVAIKERTFINIIRESELKKIDVEFELYLNNEIEIDGKVIGVELVDSLNETMPNTNNIEYINGDFLTFPLVIRKWKDGDKFQPLGLKGTKKISDFLTESKISTLERKDSLLVLNNNKIVWVVNKRIDESVKITKETKRIIKIWVK